MRRCQTNGEAMSNTIENARNAPCLKPFLLAVALVLSLASLCNARPVAILPDEKLAKKADIESGHALFTIIPTPKEPKTSGP